MNASIPSTMKAAAIERFGGPEVFEFEELPVPEPGPDEILIRVDSAGVGQWDPYEREGGFAEKKPRFPKVIGSDGAGTVVATGSRVRRFRPGDRVYAYAFMNPKGGFYAEYAAVKAAHAAKIPANLSSEEAGALAVDGLVALEGLMDHLQIRKGERVLIIGASGGAGHLAVQLARRMGAEVFAVASGRDGVNLVKKLGAEGCAEGHARNAVDKACDFAPDGFDAALVLAGGREINALLKKALRKDSRIAYPEGVEPEPKGPRGVEPIAFNGVPDPKAFERLNKLIEKGPFHVELSKVYPLKQAARAHQKIEGHHIGKLALRVH